MICEFLLARKFWNGSIPPLELTLAGVAIEPRRLAAYRDVCGFSATGGVPCTFPHVLAFPLHMALMAEPQFPFAAVGLVHVQNEISQLRPLREGETLSFAVRASEPEPHPRGRTFALLTSAHVGDELVWSERSTMLRRERSPERAARDSATAEPGPDVAGAQEDPTALARERGEVLARARWAVPGDIGRRYGAVSGDRNPIHMHALGAKAFGFPRAIAHGMWTKARCLAALERELPEAFTVDVRFRRPVTIPASVNFECDRREGAVHFALRSPTARGASPRRRRPNRRCARGSRGGRAMSVAERSRVAGLRALTRLAGSPLLDRTRHAQARRAARSTAAARTGSAPPSPPGAPSRGEQARRARRASARASERGLFDLTPDEEQPMLVRGGRRDFAAAKVRARRARTPTPPAETPARAARRRRASSASSMLGDPRGARRGHEPSAPR